MFNLKYHKNVTQGLEKPIFPLVSKRHLASLLGYDYNYLASMAAKVGRFYKPSDIKYPSGKMRHIDKPMGALRYIQDRILKNILETVEFPKTMLGGIKGRSIRQNAEYHVNQPVVVTLDLRDCFPTINNKRVYSIYRKLGCSSQIARVLTQLTTFQHRLPQGAPTSSILANLALLPLHNDILQLTNSLGLKSTIYIDDITISGTQAQETIGQIIDLIHTHGYFVSRKKKSLVDLPINAKK